jgi:steroid delta-isomerase-like uncharacterized protein
MSQAAFDTGESATVTANTRVVEAFIKDVLSEHNSDHIASYLTDDMQWHGGTVGTITGSDNVAGLFASVLTALPDLHPAVQDIFGSGNEVVVRMVVTGTQKGPILGIPASGRQVQWDAVDLFRLEDGKISQIWAGDDWTALLYGTGTYSSTKPAAANLMDGRVRRGTSRRFISPPR